MQTPFFAPLQVGSNAGIVGMTKEHLGLALALNVPVFVVVTKIDMCPANILQGQSRGAKQRRLNLIFLLLSTVRGFCLAYSVATCHRLWLPETLKLLQRLLKSPGCRKIPVLVQNKDDVIVTASNFSSERYSACPM